MTLRVSDIQYLALKDQRKRDFLSRARQFIRSRLDLDLATEDARLLYERGESYGLVSERDFARYMFIAAADGSHRRPRDSDWLARILCENSSSNDAKLARLFAEAKLHLPGRLDIARLT